MEFFLAPFAGFFVIQLHLLGLIYSMLKYLDIHSFL